MIFYILIQFNVYIIVVYVYYIYILMPKKKIMAH